MNKLDEIIESVWDSKDLDIQLSITLNPDLSKIKQVALKFAKHILEEAAENAELEVSYYGENVTGVDKKSITDTLNKYL